MADNSEESILSPGEAIQDTLNDVTRQIVDYAPEVAGAALVMLIGWLVARLLSLSARKLVQSLDSLLVRFWRPDSSQHERLMQGWARVISRVIFWVVMIFFLAVASNILGWGLFSGWMQQAFSYVPGIITGVILIVGGLILGRVVRSAVMTAGEKGAVPQRAFIAKLLQAAIVFSAILIGVEQVGLNIDFLSNVVITVTGILLAGAALAFGLGARDLMANVIGARYMQRHCEAGDHVSIGGVEGEIIEITQASIVLQTDEGKTIVPAELFHRQVTVVHTRRQ